MKYPSVKILLTVFCVSIFSPKVCRADEVNDLIQTILEVSPQERAKTTKYKTVKPKVNNSKKSIVPDLRIPDNQVLDASIKFPNEFAGKYVYGPVSFRGIMEMEGEQGIMFNGKNNRMFTLYTRDPNIIAYFSKLKWKTPFTIPRECPLRILSKEFFTYIVRMPYDKSNEAYKILDQ